MASIEQRIGRLESTRGVQRPSWLVRVRDGETAAQAIARNRATLAPFVVVAPEISRTGEEWVARYARTAT